MRTLLTLEGLGVVVVVVVVFGVHATLPHIALGSDASTTKSFVRHVEVEVGGFLCQWFEPSQQPSRLSSSGKSRTRKGLRPQARNVDFGVGDEQRANRRSLKQAADGARFLSGMNRILRQSSRSFSGSSDNKTSSSSWPPRGAVSMFTAHRRRAGCLPPHPSSSAPQRHSRTHGAATDADAAVPYLDDRPPTCIVCFCAHPAPRARAI